MFQFHHEWHFDRHDSYPAMNRHQELHNWVLPWNISQGNLLLPCFEDRCQSCEDFCYNWLNVNPVYVAGWMMKQLLEHFWTWSWNPWKLKIDSWRLRDHQRFQFHVESTWRYSKASIVKLPWSPWFFMSQVSLLSWLVESKFHHRKNELLEFSSDPYKCTKIPENDVFYFSSFLYDLLVHLAFCEAWVNVHKCVFICFLSNLALSFC